MTSPNTIIADMQAEIDALRKERDELISAQWTIAQGCAALAIEKCKNASGQRRAIDMFVSANQCAEDILMAIEKKAGAKCST